MTSLPPVRPQELPLDRLESGGSGVITRVEGTGVLTRRLLELGLVPGTRVEVLRRAPLGDPIELRLRKVHLSIRRSDAAAVHVARD